MFMFYLKPVILIFFLWARRQQRMRWLFSITNPMDMSWSKLQETEGQGSLACCSPRGHRAAHHLGTEQQWLWYVGFFSPQSKCNEGKKRVSQHKERLKDKTERSGSCVEGGLEEPVWESVWLPPARARECHGGGLIPADHPLRDRGSGRARPWHPCRFPIAQRRFLGNRCW